MGFAEGTFSSFFLTIWHSSEVYKLFSVSFAAEIVVLNSGLDRLHHYLMWNS